MQKLDKIDLAILSILQRDGRISNADLSRQVNLSPTPCFNRVRAMQKSGLIQTHVTLLNPDLLGLSLNVFVQVRLEKQTQESLEEFESAMACHPEVMECYLMTGDEDYMLRLVLPDIHALEKFILNHLSKIPSVANIRSSFALKQVLYKTSLPLPSNELTLTSARET